MLVSRISLLLLFSAPALLTAGGGIISLAGTPNPSVTGQTVTITATANISTGIVDFKDGPTLLGSSALSSGVATFTISSLSVGVHSQMTASIEIFGGSTGLYTQTVRNSTTTTLTSSGTPSTFGHSVTLTATVLPSNSTGKATFYDGTAVLGTSDLVSGVATLSSVLIGPGVRSLKAYYVGDVNNFPSTSPALPQTSNSIAGAGFNATVNYSASAMPQAMAFGDFNGDGHVDIVTANAGGTVNIWLGNSNGTFSAATSINAGSDATSVAVGDFDGDGYQDLAVADIAGNANVLYGNGDGTFSTFVSYPAGTAPTSIAVGDFNGDGVADIVVSNTDGVSVLLGKGDGTFYAPVPYAAGLAPAYLVVGDFNGDGKPDLAVAGGTSVSVLLGVGDGTFATAVVYSAGAAPRAIAIGDFDGDNYLDLAVTGSSTSAVSVLIGNGDGTFKAPVSYATAGTSLWVAVADFNGDGHPDLVVADTSGSSITVLLNDGTGLFPTSTNDTVGGGPVAVLAGDFNGDGSADIVSANHIDSNISVLVGIPAALPTTTGLTSSLNPSIVGENVTFTATVTPTSATGSVTFKDGLTTLGTGTLTTGTTTYATTALSVASHSITAVYGGDSTNATSTSTVLSQVVGAQTVTTTALSVAPNPSTFGQSVTLTATVSPSSATGTVTFKDGVTTLGTGALSTGTATYSTQAFNVAVHSLTAVYGGDVVDAGSTSIAASQTVNQAVTTSVLSSSVNPSTFGESITLTASLSPSTVTGTVTFMNATTSLGTGTLTAGIATLAVSTLAVGMDPLSAVYAGDTNDAATTSPIYTQTVTKASTTTALTSSVNPSPLGLSVTLSAAVSPSSATGSVIFKDGSTTLGTSTLTSGVATLAVPAFTLGSHTLIAVYSSDIDFTASTSPALIQVVKPATSTSLISSANPVEFGHAVTMTATVTPSLATGKITFYDGTIVLGIAPVVTGQAVFTTTLLGAGPRKLTAYYSGDATNAFSASTALAETVNAQPGAGFLPAVTYDVGPYPFGAVVGDFNKDGISDLVVCNLYTNTISVLLGKGDGTFHAAVNYVVGRGPTSIASGDFNGDGNADLVVADGNDNNLSLLLGNGDGTFQAKVVYATDHLPQSVTVGDFNGDGKVDLAFTNGRTNSVGIALGNGDGTFGAYVDYSVGSSPSSVAVGDLNGDGIPDLVVTNEGAGTISVLIGKGDGTFLAGVVYTTGPEATFTAIGDFNGDSIADLAVSNAANSTVSVLLGVGDGTFSAAVDYPVGPVPLFVALGDFNGDGFLDLAVGSIGGTAISVLHGVGDGTFQTALTYSSIEGVSTVVVGDFNGDGLADIAFTGDTNSDVGILLGQLQPTSTTLTSSLNPSTFGQSVTLTATVSPSSATGTITFMDGSTVLGTATISGGVATLLLFTLPAGSPSLTAVYSGDANDAASTSIAFVQTVNQSVTTTTLTSSLNPSNYHVSVTFTARVSNSLATGTVTFKEGSTVLGTGTLAPFSPGGPTDPVETGANPGARATLSLSTLIPGSHVVTAVYPGDANDFGSTSPLVTQVVNPAITVTTLTSSMNPAAYGQAFILTASVSPSTATGTIVLKDGAAVLVTAGLINGSVTFASPLLASGTHALSAVYGGDIGDVGSTGALSVVIGGCTTVATPSIFADSNAVTETITITSNPFGCPWTISTSSPWIQISGSAGAGSGTAMAALSLNSTGAVRTGTILVGGQTVSVLQRATAQLFADVPPNLFYFDAANMLYARQVTSGCSTNPLNYCPNLDIPRWEMAVFIVRAVYGGDNFTASPTPYFNDVPVGSEGFAWIQKMYELGITSGCGSGNFCPATFVPREQMAVFVIRMRYGSTAVFDFPVAPYFTDVTPQTFGWSWIQRMKNDQLTSGCAVSLFCPTGLVTRSDMAMFIMLGGFNALLPANTPMISAIAPSTITRGTTATYTITGLSTNFVQGVTTITAMPGITVGAVTVASPTSLSVQLTAALGATLQPTSVQAITGNPPGNEEAVLPNGLLIQ